jgi:hypothetical protein
MPADLLVLAQADRLRRFDALGIKRKVVPFGSRT